MPKIPGICLLHPRHSPIATTLLSLAPVLNFFIAFSHRQIDAISMQNDFPDEASLRFIPRCMSTTVGHGLVRYATPSSPTSRVTQKSLLVAMLASSTTLDSPSSGVNEAFDRYREANLTLERFEP